MIIKRLAVLAAAGGLAMALVACGSSSTTTAASSAGTTSAMSSAAAPMSSGAMSSGATGASALVGSGCAAYAKAVPSGAGSVGGMAADPVATAASNNPLLTTLVAAVSGKVNPKVNLVNTLNSGDFTVFAPVDDAFKKIDAATMTKLTTDDALLTKILTYHVISGQLDPTQLVGTHKTVEGSDVTVTGSGNDIKINGTSTVICGNVKTKNATVYLIDTVLTPPADSGAMTSGAMSSGAMTSGAMTSGAMTSGAMTSGGATAAGAALVGPGCAAYAKAVPSGAGSVGGMAADPVATAASNNPLLTTLVAAVSGKVNPKVNLVNTLNSGDFTVFAPVDDAFKAVDAATMTKLTTDSALLTKILTYHVISGQLDPTQLVGTHKTVEGSDVTVTGSGNDLKVNGVGVICGNVKTKNATVYLIGSVLNPTS